MVRPAVVVTPPLPVTTEDGGSVEIRLREGITAQELLSGALRVVVNTEEEGYLEPEWELNGNEIGLGLHTQYGSTTIGTISNYDGRKKILLLGQMRSGYTIVDILVTSSMPEVVMYPSVLNQDVEQAVMLFRETMPKQALVDGALEMYIESERWGNQYTYPEVSEENILRLYIGGTLHFSANVQSSNKRLYIERTAGWSDPEIKYSQPNRLAWMEGYTLEDGIDGVTLEGLPEDVTVIAMSLTTDGNSLDAVLTQSEGKCVRSFDTEQSTSPAELRFSGELSPQTIFSSYPKPENIVAIPLRLQLVESEYIALYPLYAMRKNRYTGTTEAARRLKLADGSGYATVGTPSPVLFNVI